MLTPKRPDFSGAAFRLNLIFPRLGQKLISQLQTANHEKKLLPAWREDQIIRFVNALNLYAGDLNDRYRARRIDALATTVRNLAELGVWVRYCSLSEQNAKRFYEDSVRDFRDILEAMQKLYTSANGEPQEDLSKIITLFQNAAVTHGIKDYDERYIQVRDAAKEIGRSEAFSVLYKVFSKLAHPTSLILALDPQTGSLTEMLDALYVGGEDFAVGTIHEIEKFIEKTLSPVAMTVTSK